MMHNFHNSQVLCVPLNDGDIHIFKAQNSLPEFFSEQCTLHTILHSISMAVDFQLENKDLSVVNNEKNRLPSDSKNGGSF